MPSASVSKHKIRQDLLEHWRDAAVEPVEVEDGPTLVVRVLGPFVLDVLGPFVLEVLGPFVLELLGISLELRGTV